MLVRKSSRSRQSRILSRKWQIMIENGMKTLFKTVERTIEMLVRKSSRKRQRRILSTKRKIMLENGIENYLKRLRNDRNVSEEVLQKPVEQDSKNKTVDNGRKRYRKLSKTVEETIEMFVKKYSRTSRAGFCPQKTVKNGRR